MGEPASSKQHPTSHPVSSRRRPGSDEVGSQGLGNPSDLELSHALGQLDLALLLIELDHFTVTAASEAALDLVGMTPTAIVQHPVFDLIGDQDRSNALLALQAMRAGVIDFYRAHRRIGTIGPSGTLATAWVRAIDFGDSRVALSELVDGAGPRQSPLVAYFGRDPLQMAIGGIDASGVVTSVSNDIDMVLGVSARDFVGRSLLGAPEQREVGGILDAPGPTRAGTSVSLRIRLEDAKGRPTPLCSVITSLAGSNDRLFILIADRDLPAVQATDRASQLEHHLWRIAAEVEASGILHRVGNASDAARFAQSDTLSVRQWEVLQRLIRGERVPTIAGALFVSQSTVRNHLSAIFKRFGVHSQAELLALLERTDESPS
jgi:DNA-binding CsgD family transcriptional regulator